MNTRARKDGDAGDSSFPTSPLRAVDGGVVIEVLARPAARRSEIVGLQGGRLKVAVTAPARDGQANSAIIVLLAAKLGIPKSNCSVLRGQTGRLKTLLAADITQDQVKNALGI